MSDSGVPRVLWALERVALRIHELEVHLSSHRDDDPARYNGLSRTAEESLRQREQFELGRIDGLVTAALIVHDLIVWYRDKHRTTRGRLKPSMGSPNEEIRPAETL